MSEHASNGGRLDPMRILVTGASGSGTTTLASSLATTLGFRHLDADDYYWLPTSPPFRDKRPAEERLVSLAADLASAAGAAVSGSVVGWGAAIEDAFDLIVFLYLPADVRIERLRVREVQRYGRADPAFLEWAALYDVGPPEGRSLRKHNAWLARRQCRVLRLDGDESLERRLARVCQAVPALAERSRAG